MKHAGQPKSAPSWYRDREQKESPIEKQFSSELGDLASLIEQESWFGDSEQHDRYRVDFILKDARLIIELDGHGSHSTKKQLKKDAIRQRYLTRAGYSVIRFTGSEVYQDAAKCVEEVRTIYKERMQRAPAKYRVMYLDYNFLISEKAKALAFFKDMHPERVFPEPSIEEYIFSSFEWLREKSFITVFLFVDYNHESEVKHLDGMVREFQKGEVRINVMPDEDHLCELGQHLVSYSHLYDQFILAADDKKCIEPATKVVFLSNSKIIRKNNRETNYLGTELVRRFWQNVWYIIGHTLGLSVHEM